MVRPRGDRAAWRTLFAADLVPGVLIYRLAGGPLQAIDITGSIPVLIAGGLLVGFGTQMSNDCTSGRDVCGIARISIRTIAATVTFIVAAGVIFGLGLAVSKMVNPGKVLGLLDVAGRWEHTLLVVMAGALVVTGPAFRLILRMPAPRFGEAFEVFEARGIDARLVGGAGLFGAG